MSEAATILAALIRETDDHGSARIGLGEVHAIAAELDRLRAENTTLRALLPKLGAPCAYCGLTEIAKCAHGFPGCPQADDLMAGQEEGWQETVKRMRAAEAAAQRRLELLEQAMFYIPDGPRNALTERAHALNDAIQAEMAKEKGS